MDRHLEPDAAHYRGALGRARHRAARERPVHTDARREPPAHQPLTRSLDSELRPVRHRQPVAGHEHPDPLDIPARRGSIHRVQPQPARHFGPLAIGFESAPHQAAVRMALVTPLPSPRILWKACAASGIAIGILLNDTADAQTINIPLSASSFDVKAARVTKPPVIDGDVGDSEWEGAAVVTSFIQYEPRRGDQSDVRTDALVLYDAGHLYVAFRAWDTEPITAQLTQRDADLLRDDAVTVVVDTTFDRRTGYYFITNALG